MIIDKSKINKSRLDKNPIIFFKTFRYLFCQSPSGRSSGPEASVWRNADGEEIKLEDLEVEMCSPVWPKKRQNRTQETKRHEETVQKGIQRNQNHFEFRERNCLLLVMRYRQLDYDDDDVAGSAILSDDDSAFSFCLRPENCDWKWNFACEALRIDFDNAKLTRKYEQIFKDFHLTKEIDARTQNDASRRTEIDARTQNDASRRTEIGVRAQNDARTQNDASRRTEIGASSQAQINASVRTSESLANETVRYPFERLIEVNFTDVAGNPTGNPTGSSAGKAGQSSFVKKLSAEAAFGLDEEARLPAWLTIANREKVPCSRSNLVTLKMKF